MIHYVKHNQIDKQKWDACIASSREPLVYACSWYLDIVSPNWDALIKDDYSAVMPLTKRKKYFIPYLFQPAFTQQLGIFAASPPDETASFLNAIPSKFRLIEIQLNLSNYISSLKSFQVLEKITFHLCLEHHIEEIKNNYSENIKRNIKKFEKFDLTISNEKSADDIITLFKNHKGSSLDSLSKNDYEVLEQIFSSASNKDLLKIKKVYNESGHLIAGAVFLKSFDAYIFLFSAIHPEARENGAMSSIINCFIEENARACKTLDFEGSMIPALARFYESFGSEEIVYLQIRRNTLPPIIRKFK